MSLTQSRIAKLSIRFVKLANRGNVGRGQAELDHRAMYKVACTLNPAFTGTAWATWFAPTLAFCNANTQETS